VVQWKVETVNRNPNDALPIDDDDDDDLLSLAAKGWITKHT